MVRHLAALFLCLTATPLLAADFTAPDMAFLQAGILCPPPAIAVREAPGTVAGVTNVIDVTPEFLSDGRKLPAAKGLAFGVTAQSDAIIYDPVTIRVTHPPMGPEGTTQQEYLTRIGPEGPSISLYHLEYGYEMVTGPWSISAFAGERLLYRVEFAVVPPAQVPQLARICGFEHLLS